MKLKPFIFNEIRSPISYITNRELYIHPFQYLLIHPSLYPSFYSFIHPSIHYLTPIHLSNHLFILLLKHSFIPKIYQAKICAKSWVFFNSIFYWFFNQYFSFRLVFGVWDSSTFHYKMNFILNIFRESKQSGHKLWHRSQLPSINPK